MAISDGRSLRRRCWEWGRHYEKVMFCGICPVGGGRVWIELGQCPDHGHHAGRQDVLRAGRGDGVHAEAGGDEGALARGHVFRGLGAPGRRRVEGARARAVAVPAGRSRAEDEERQAGIRLHRGERGDEGRQTRAQEPPLGEARVLPGRRRRAAGADPDGGRAGGLRRLLGRLPQGTGGRADGRADDARGMSRQGGAPLRRAHSLRGAMARDGLPHDSREGVKDEPDADHGELPGRVAGRAAGTEGRPARPHLDADQPQRLRARSRSGIREAVLQGRLRAGLRLRHGAEVEREEGDALLEVVRAPGDPLPAVDQDASRMGRQGAGAGRWQPGRLAMLSRGGACAGRDADQRERILGLRLDGAEPVQTAALHLPSGMLVSRHGVLRSRLRGEAHHVPREHLVLGSGRLLFHARLAHARVSQPEGTKENHLRAGLHARMASGRHAEVHGRRRVRRGDPAAAARRGLEARRRAVRIEGSRLLARRLARGHAQDGRRRKGDMLEVRQRQRLRVPSDGRRRLHELPQRQAGCVVWVCRTRKPCGQWAGGTAHGVHRVPPSARGDVVHGRVGREGQGRRPAHGAGQRGVGKRAGRPRL